MSENLVNVFMGFLAGFNLGLVVCAVLVWFRVKNAMLSFYDKEKATIEKMLPPPSVPAKTNEALATEESVNLRLQRASELTRLQNEIMQQAQQPSQNALHSKHKNGLIQQYKALETEKMGVLESIVKDGHDPLVTVFNAASKQNQEVKLSQFLQQFKPAEAAETDPNLPLTEGDGIRKIVKEGKTFFVIDGGKKTTQ